MIDVASAASAAGPRVSGGLRRAAQDPVRAATSDALRRTRGKSAIRKSGYRFCVRSRSNLMNWRMIFSANRLHFAGSCA